MKRVVLSCLAVLAVPAWADGGTPLETLALPGLVASGDLGARLTAARRALGLKYVPRTRHLAADGTPKYTNRLILETSPYLLQHAHNPVNWYPWGDEALARAKAEGKPLFISIGYSTCHWCHVMERESFEDEDIAALINQRFIPIKVDREEHPDIDAAFMSAVYALNGRGGWPMTVVATPAGEPFFAATYLPPRDSPEGGRGLSSLLTRLADVYAKDPARLVSTARQLTAELDRRATPAAPGQLPGVAVLDNAVSALAASFDAANGGFGGAPKFPSPASVELLLRQHHRTGDAKALQMATRTLEAMARGGIYDQLGGGFHRYSTDAQWRVPHFEKMLYDNAQLASLYLDAYQLTGNAEFAVVARETLAYLERDMLSPEGAFFSASDADSAVGGHGGEREGYFFTWTPAELKSVLGASVAAHLAAVYGVTEKGDLDGRSVLHREAPLADVARTLHLDVAQLQREVDEARLKLLAARAKRTPPARDEKVIAAWNGLALSAFARGAVVLEDPALAARATKVAELLTRTLLRDGRLSRSWRAGRTSGAGTLEDYAFVEQGLLDLHEATQDTKWLELARALQATTDAHFAGAASSAYFRFSDEVPRVLFREVPDDDGAEPSGNSVAALNLLRLHELTEVPAYQERALAVLRAQASVAARGVGASKLLAALDFALSTPAQVVVVESAPDAGVGLLAAFKQVYQPNHVLVRAVEGDELRARQRQVPLLEGRVAKKGLATGYVCRHRTCELPTSDPAVFKKQLEKR